MDRSRTVRTLLLATVVLATVAAGCLGGQSDDPGEAAPDGPSTTDEPTDETEATVDEPAGGDGSTEGAADGGNGTSENGSDDVDAVFEDDSNSSTPASVPDIDERAVADHVREMIREYRETTGYRDVRHTQGVVITADRVNRGLEEREVTPPLEANATRFDLSENDLLERFVEEGSGECERDGEEVVGLVTAARHVPTLAEEGRGQGATLEERIADHVVFTWKRSDVTEGVLQRAYRFIGVAVRYDENRGVAYVTAAFC